jgi:glycosyltransferase involved in cell wall biosynthesis
MQRVFHVITGLNDGGAEGALYRLCCHDTANRHSVISLMDEGKYGPRLERLGVPVYCLNMPQGRPSLSGLWRLWRLLRSQQPEVLQTWLYHADLIGGLVGRLAGISRVVWGIRHGGLGEHAIKGSTRWVVRLCASLSSWLPAQIVCCSENAANEHIARGYQANKFVLIPNGYDLKALQSSAEAVANLRQQLEIEPETPLIGMVARFHPQKDHRNLLSALQRLKSRGQSFYCLLVGSDMNQANVELTEIIDQLGLAAQVRLLGRRDDIGAIMAGLDLHVLSSSGEAFPNVLAEAMACATPCVTTDVGDARVIVSKFGWVVPAQNAELLANGINEAILLRAQQPQQWQQMRLQAKAHIEKEFSIEQMCQRFNACWDAL